MPRYAAVDIGSNSTRMAVAEIEPGKPWKILATDREVTRLGASVFAGGQVSEEAMDRVCRTLARFRQTYQKIGVQGIRVVATSAIRDARNQELFLMRASQAVGAQVEVISGLEEARLIHAGMNALWPHPKQRILIIDIGGGSAQVVVSEKGRLVSSMSRPLGAVRLTEVFLKSDPPGKEELARMEAFIEEKVTAMIARTGLGKFDRTIATSATAAAAVSALNGVARAKREAADRMSAPTAGIGKLVEKLAKRNVAQRRKVPGIGPKRAEIAVAGTTVLHRILRAYKRPTVHYSSAGVRDGILADLAARKVGQEAARLGKEQKQAVEQMARRFGVDVAHARKTAQTAAKLFEATRALHQLPMAAGRLLEAAAYLVDTGHYVSDMGHHKHSHYLVAHCDMPAFTSQERQILALLCRFHRKSMPQPRHAFFHEQSAEVKRQVLYLTPLLRLADSLDRSHDQRVDGLQVSVGTNSVTVELFSDADTNLEIWAGERVNEVFQGVYGQKLILRRGKKSL